MDLTFNGEHVVKEVYFREEIFKGPHAGKGPDLYALPHYGFDLKGAFNKPAVFGTTHFKGMHTHDDAHLFISEKLQPDQVNIDNIAPLVSRYLNGDDSAAHQQPFPSARTRYTRFHRSETKRLMQHRLALISVFS